MKVVRVLSRASNGQHCDPIESWLSSVSCAQKANTMAWQICIQYSDGSEQVLRSYKNRETALKYVDALYARGYPMHYAYVARPATADKPLDSIPQLALVVQ